MILYHGLRWINLKYTIIVFIPNHSKITVQDKKEMYRLDSHPHCLAPIKAQRHARALIDQMPIGVLELPIDERITHLRLKGRPLKG
jgi:hypothetical protein